MADAVTQVECVQRAARLRRALGRGWASARRLPSWPDVLLCLAGVLDAEVLARVIQWRGDAGIADIEAMTDNVLAHFTAAMRHTEEEPFVALFADELVRLGLLDPSALTGEAGPVRRAADTL